MSIVLVTVYTVEVASKTYASTVEGDKFQPSRDYLE